MLKILFPIAGSLKNIKIEFQHVTPIFMWIGSITSNQSERLDQRFCVAHKDMTGCDQIRDGG